MCFPCVALSCSGMPLEELQQAQGFLGPLYYVAFKVREGRGAHAGAGWRGDAHAGAGWRYPSMARFENAERGTFGTPPGYTGDGEVR